MFKEQGLTPSTKQNLNIETLRGLACLLLVAYHVIGSHANVGLQVEAGSIARYSQDILAYIRMPLFTFLSGYVYAMRPFSSGATSFLLSKARRLLIPMLVVGTLYAIIRNLVGGSNQKFETQDWLTIHLLPVDHFWFVEALFWIFALIVMLEHYQIIKKIQHYLLVLGCVIFLHIMAVPLPPYLAIDKALYLLPYFLIGLGVYRYQQALFQPKYIILMFSLFLLVFAFASTEIIHAPEPILHQQSLSAVIIGGLSATLLVASQIKIPFLARIGAFSYSIYLFHTFATAASRIILQKFGIDAFAVLFILGTASGIAAPVLIEIIARRYRLAATLFLGRRLKKKNANSPLTQNPSNA